MTLLITFFKTPVWVWGILAYLIFVGLLARKPRTISIYRLFIMPTIFLVMKFPIFFSGDPMGSAVYAVDLLIGIFLGYSVGSRSKIGIDAVNKTIIWPGNNWLLVLLLSFFTVKYVCGFMLAINPASAAIFLLVELAVTGLFSGFMTGNTIAYLRRVFIC